LLQEYQPEGTKNGKKAGKPETYTFDLATVLPPEISHEKRKYGKHHDGNQKNCFGIHTKSYFLTCVIVNSTNVISTTVPRLQSEPSLQTWAGAWFRQNQNTGFTVISKLRIRIKLTKLWARTSASLRGKTALKIFSMAYNNQPLAGIIKNNDSNNYGKYPLQSLFVANKSVSKSCMLCI